MGHDTNHGHSKENVTIISFKNSFWLIIILVGLFIAALNFVQAESGGEEGHEGAATHEMQHEGGAATHEAKEGHEAAATEHKAEEPKHEEAPKAEEPKAEHK